jgi:hypothetical protein
MLVLSSGEISKKSRGAGALFIPRAELSGASDNAAE